MRVCSYATDVARLQSGSCGDVDPLVVGMRSKKQQGRADWRCTHGTSRSILSGLMGALCA